MTNHTDIKIKCVIHVTASDFCHAQTHAVFTEVTDVCDTVTASKVCIVSKIQLGDIWLDWTSVYSSFANLVSRSLRLRELQDSRFMADCNHCTFTLYAPPVKTVLINRTLSGKATSIVRNKVRQTDLVCDKMHWEFLLKQNLPLSD